MTIQQRFLLVVGGPTAVGKTGVAIKLAKHFNTEIISADARQFYREMTIGTAKPTVKEQIAVTHHFIDSLSVTDDYNVGRFESDALKTLSHLYGEHEVAVMVGGSGLFIRAVCHGLDALPDVDPTVRQQLNELYSHKGLPAIQELLKEKDPDYFAVVDTGNPQRIIRALEVCLSTGKPFSAFHSKQAKPRKFTPIKIGLNVEREKLYAHINHRVDEMVKQGLVEEVRSLLPSRHLNALQTVGYTELFDYFDGTTTLDKAIELIKQHTRNYAKRQLTWFRKEKDIQWFEPTELDKMVTFITENMSK